MHELQNKGNKIFIIIIRPEQKNLRVEYTIENNIDIVIIRPPSYGINAKKGILRHLNYLLCLPTISKEANKIILEHKIDFIYSYMPGTGSSLPAIRIKSKHNIPLILDLADMYSMIRPKKIISDAFKKSDKIIVITDYLKNKLLEQNISKDKIFKIPNGVDLELFNPKNYNDDEIKKLRESFNSKKLIIFAGSLQDLNIIIDSAHNVVKNYPDVMYVIIGDHRDPNRSKEIWEEKVKQRGLESNFKFLGRKPREEIPLYLLSADICLDSFPNEPYYAAAHPVKLLEYGSCGKPVVATNVSETEKIVKHNEFGFLANPDNAQEYSEFILTLLNDSKLCEKMGFAFSTFIRSEFGWKNISEKLSNFLDT
mgnify:CR=1 FL=1|jgi:glycosyltransferase involved in cell wall biosynthesis